MTLAATQDAIPRPQTLTVAPPVGERELRLDLFRGLALWLIFIDHLPDSVLTWFTMRNYGFSDATEIFIFISGYTVAFVNGRAMQNRGIIVASARILKRAWQIYVAHIFLFTIYLAEISYVAARFDNPLYAEEMNILDFLKSPGETIIEALLLRFRPVNMDVLPLYIVLMVFFPPVLWLLRKKPDLALLLSVALYAMTWELELALPSYPSGSWFFNPYAWQLLFVFGAWCALGGARRMSRILTSKITLGLAAAYLAFACAVAITWYIPKIDWMPDALARSMYNISKTDLDVLRFAHFLALATLTVHFIPKGWPGLTSAWLRPMVLCGQHSLEIFCFGVFLDFAGRFVLVEYSGGAWMHSFITIAGIGLMCAAAWLLAWYKGIAEGGTRAATGAS